MCNKGNGYKSWWLGLWGVLMVLFASLAQAQVSKISTAMALIKPQISEPVMQIVSLPHSWDASYPREGGRVIYKIALPESLLDEPSAQSDTYPSKALYVLHAGNQVVIRLNGMVLTKFGRLGDEHLDAGKEPIYFVLPRILLKQRQDRQSQLEIEMTTQFARSGGLSEVYVGDAGAIKQLYDAGIFWRQTLYGVIALSLGLMGILGLALYAPNREPLFFFFVAMSLFGVIRAVDQMVSSVPMLWGVWHVLMMLAQAYYMLFMMRFALEAAGCGHEPWVQRWFRIFLIVCLITSVMTQISFNAYYWRLTLFGFLVYASFSLVWVLRSAWRRPEVQSVLTAIVCTLVYTVGVRDYLVVEISPFGLSTIALLPAAMLLFGILMAWYYIDHYTAQSKALLDSNSHLEIRIASREAQLAASFEQQQAQSSERARLLERERIMQDIHDGVGGQLVSLVNRIKREQSGLGARKSPHLLEHAQLALDELRIAVDAMQPMDGDLAAVLATLRYRFEPRLKALGITWQWQVDELPQMPDLTPQKVLQIQKILLEALTNVMQHAKASAIKVSAKTSYNEEGQAREIIISLQDNGLGFQTPMANTTLSAEAQMSTFGEIGAGHGLRNMRFRAQAIGAKIEWAAAHHSFAKTGTRVALTLPINSTQSPTPT